MRRFLAALAFLALAACPALANVTANISNAPIWHTSTSYNAPVSPARFGSRVNSGPGTIGGSYTSLSAVYVWAAQNSGTSAASGNGPQSCPTPGTTTFNDNGITWLCLGSVDYVTFSSWAFDDLAYVPSFTDGTCTAYITPNGGYGTMTVSGCASGKISLGDQISGAGVTSGTTVSCNSSVSGLTECGSGAAFGGDSGAAGGAGTYYVNFSQTVGSSGSPITITATTGYTWHAYARSNGNIYRADQGGVKSCLTGGSPPSGTSNGQTDGTCVWDFAVPVPYRSGVPTTIPHQMYPNALADGNACIGGAVVAKQGIYIGQFFSGGTGPTDSGNTGEYLPNTGGEGAYLTIQAHYDFNSDVCLTGDEYPPVFVAGVSFSIRITCPPIDCTTSGGSSIPLRYDPSQRSAFRNTLNSTSMGSIPSGNLWANFSSGLVTIDDSVQIIGVDIKSDYGLGIQGFRNSGGSFTNAVVDANGIYAYFVDGGAVVNNALIINRSSLAGAIGFRTYYVSLLYNSVIYMPNGGTNSVCFETSGEQGFGGPWALEGYAPYVQNDAFFGCAHWISYVPGLGPLTPNGNQFGNVTDHANTDSGLFKDASGSSQIAFAPMGVSGSACSGSCYGLSFSSVFNSTSDLREKSTSPTIGIGGAVSIPPDAGNPGYPTYTNPTDIFGTARPYLGAYDPGPWQYAGSSPRGISPATRPR